ncbi:hypothetical protein [Rhizobium esperanzae]|uniref:hypothetical protein n=1 Tax=Rhizobium esperanzae TaxID=1967781 RepID=UPI0011320A8A|nr:hypothetical protein [Rhizobium esperanzae]
MFNMPGLVALILVCAVLIRFDHGGIAKAIFWGYFAAVLFVILRNYRWKFLTATEFYAMGLALICCFAAVKVMELASYDHIAQLRANNPTVGQMAVADDNCPDFVQAHRHGGSPYPREWAFCVNYLDRAGEWRELSKDARKERAAWIASLHKQASAKIDVEPTASTTETSSDLWN